MQRDEERDDSRGDDPQRDHGSDRDDEREERTVTIIVNAQPKTVRKARLTFDEIVELAYPGGPRGENWVYTVSYRRGVPPKPSGTLIQGQSVKVKDRMIFDVSQTDKS